jgi:hypothetical protein
MWIDGPFPILNLYPIKNIGDRASDSLLLPLYHSLYQALAFSVPGLFCIEFVLSIFLVKLAKEAFFYCGGFAAKFKTTLSTSLKGGRGKLSMKNKCFIICASPKYSTSS